MSLDAHDAALTARRPAPAPPHLQHPNEVSLNVNLQESVWRLLENDDPPNKKKQHEPKMKEYFEFCRMMYLNDPHFSILKQEKMYQFMYYQAFQEKKQRGGSIALCANQGAFNLAHYRDVMGSFADPNTGNNLTATPAPAEPISKSVFDAYKATFRKIFRSQKMRGVLLPQLDDLWTMEFDDIRKHVLFHAPRHKKETYQEKISNDFAPYLYVDKYDAMEEELWRDGTENHGHRNVASGLQHRYVLLHLTSGILQCESLYKAELSDFCGVVVPSNNNDAHRMLIMVNQISFGKTNHGRTIYSTTM
jgi:hypothetical protein